MNFVLYKVSNDDILFEYWTSDFIETYDYINLNIKACFEGIGKLIRVVWWSEGGCMEGLTTSLKYIIIFTYFIIISIVYVPYNPIWYPHILLSLSFASYNLHVDLNTTSNLFIYLSQWWTLFTFNIQKKFPPLGFGLASLIWK